MGQVLAPTIWRGKPLVVEEVSSTQDVVKSADFPPFVPFVALKQTAGRGRKGRWHSPRGGGLYLSFKLPLSFFGNEAELSPISLVVGCAVSQTVDAYALSKIKWPNDVYLGGKKVGGILVERNSRFLTVGIGVNLNNKGFPPELQHYATSLYLELQREVDFGEFLNLLLENLSEELLRFAEEGFSPFAERINRKLLWRNRRVLINNSECGKLLGVDERGRAVVKTCYGKIKRLSYGDISLRSL